MIDLERYFLEGEHDTVIVAHYRCSSFSPMVDNMREAIDWVEAHESECTNPAPSV